MAGGRAALIRRFTAARRDPDLALLEGLHVLKHALRFGAEIEVACTPDLDALLALARGLAPDLCERLGQIVGEVAPAVLDALNLEAPVVAAELELDVLLDAPRRNRTFRAPSRFPASLLDLAFVVDESVAAASIEATLRTELGDVLEAVRCFDVFRSDSLGAGRRSLAFTLRLRAPDRTLTDTEAGELRARAVRAVERAHGAELRG